MRAAMGRREATRRNLRREEEKGLEGEGLEFIVRSEEGNEKGLVC